MVPETVHERVYVPEMHTELLYQDLLLLDIGTGDLEELKLFLDKHVVDPDRVPFFLSIDLVHYNGMRWLEKSQSRVKVQIKSRTGKFTAVMLFKKLSDTVFIIAAHPIMHRRLIAKACPLEVHSIKRLGSNLYWMEL